MFVFTGAPELSIGKDTSLCYGDSIVLAAPAGFLNYLWNTGSTQDSITVSETGNYSVEIEDEYGCFAQDTINILINPEVAVNLGPDHLVCEGDSVVLDAGASYVSYLWQDGSSQEDFVAKQSGIYWVEVMDNLDCSASDTVYIEVVDPPVIYLGPDSIICEGESILLDPGPGFASYQWQDGSTQQEFLASETGIYWVEVANAPGCTSSDTTYLEVIQLPSLSIGNDTTVCEEFEIILDAGNGYDYYDWQDGSQSQTYLADQPGLYWVFVELSGCAQGDSILITEECPSLIWFPNSFTPNGDGRNDIFAPVWDHVEQYNLTIFNRWGALVFESKSIEFGWDGKFNGDPSPTGVYVFVAEYIDEISGETQIIKGSLILLQ